MKNLVFVLMMILTVSAEAQETRSELVEAINKTEVLTLDKFGNLNVDLGSASAGRFSVNINKTSIKLELRGEEPGCADYCPARALIWFECEDGPCVSDPVMNQRNQYESAVASFSIDGGIQVYYILTKFKFLDFIDLSKY